jgi:putative transposase
LFGDSKVTYYRWKKQVSAEVPPLHQLIIDICQSLSFRVGHRKIKGILQNDHHIQVNRKIVQKIMLKYNLQCQVKVKRKVYIAGESKFVVPNLLNQDFKADRPN